MNMILLHGALKRDPFNLLNGTEKWAMLFAMCESDDLGVAIINRAIFTIETGITEPVFDSAISKLGSRVVTEGDHHWFCDLLHENYGRCAEKMRWNRMFPTLIKKLVRNRYPPKILSAMLSAYPFLSEHYTRFRDTGVAPSLTKPAPKKPKKEDQSPPPPDDERC